MSDASQPDLAAEVIAGLALNRQNHGVASAEAVAVTLIGAALRFILISLGPEAARSNVEQVRLALEDVITLNEHQKGAVH